MTHVITSLCLRDGGCVPVCPVECIVPGNPQDKYPTFYIDPDTCIDCGACIPECPFDAIFPQDEVPTHLVAKAGQRSSKPVGTSGFSEEYSGKDHEGHPVHLKGTRTLTPGEVLDLTPDLDVNADFFKNGPGYKAVGK
jgi:ferredoxin